MIYFCIVSKTEVHDNEMHAYIVLHLLFDISLRSL